ncbi:hypothetical protein MHY85_08515 [Cellulomonas sp. ACRRI]|uniref:hypothetical protein n=1 Tax=Cellulomonas sp. ACRRI TaxID=2918188 RepID=UPI001EF16A4E|nr:hypothetical protein [Cellulomonas sp. ACRRI]MCG7286016.1 hypothetical protein [Cellulomonas sp. ACRRI]
MTGLLAVAHGTLLQGWGAVAAAVDPSPSPSSIEIPPEDQTSPGLLGFLVTFAAAAAVILLGFSMVRHLRVVDRNARRLREAEEGTSAGAAGTSAGAAGTSAATPSGTASPSARADDDPDATGAPGATPPRGPA